MSVGIGVVTNSVSLVLNLTPDFFSQSFIMCQIVLYVLSLGNLAYKHYGKGHRLWLQISYIWVNGMKTQPVSFSSQFNISIFSNGKIQPSFHVNFVARLVPCRIHCATRCLIDFILDSLRAIYSNILLACLFSFSFPIVITKVRLCHSTFWKASTSSWTVMLTSYGVSSLVIPSRTESDEDIVHHTEPHFHLEE